MKRFPLVAAVLLATALAGTARAEPKVITLDYCVKVEQEVRKDQGRQTITVKCTGEVFDPEVRKSETTIWWGSPGLTSSQRRCITSEGKYFPC